MCGEGTLASPSLVALSSDLGPPPMDGASVPSLPPSFFPPPRKNDQKNYRGAKLTTGQTIASTSPVHVKRRSPTFKKKSLAKSDTISQKSIASRSQSPVASC